MIDLLKFVISAKFIIGLIIGGAGMYISQNWKKKK